MFCSPRNLARIASRAPGQQSGKRQLSPIRVATWIMRQQPQQHPHKPENFSKTFYDVEPNATKYIRYIQRVPKKAPFETKRG